METKPDKTAGKTAEAETKQAPATKQTSNEKPATKQASDKKPASKRTPKRTPKQASGEKPAPKTAKKQASSEKPASKRTPKKRTPKKKEEAPQLPNFRLVGECCLFYILAGEKTLPGTPVLTYEQVLAKVLEHFPDRQTTQSCIKWYASKLRSNSPQIARAMNWLEQQTGISAEEASKAEVLKFRPRPPARG